MKKNCFKSCFYAKSARPTSPRSVAVRGIGAAPHLYPALQACGMTKCVVRGFTLIELLVVVLIIGILAAVAVPQYKRAVTKAQFTKYRVLADSLAKAARVYYLKQGDWPHSFEVLDADLPGDMSSVVTNEANHATCASGSEIYCCMVWPRESSYTGTIYCGKNDYSLLYGRLYATSNGNMADAARCVEFSSDIFCKTLPGATSQSSAAIIRPNATWNDSKPVQYYAIDY